MQLEKVRHIFHMWHVAGFAASRLADLTQIMGCFRRAWQKPARQHQHISIVSIAKINSVSFLVHIKRELRLVGRYMAM